MASLTLYPPVIPDRLDAFIYIEDCSVPIAISSFNTEQDLNPVLTQVKITYLSSNQSALNAEEHINGIAIKTLQNGQVTITSNDLDGGFTPGTIYKVQMRFTAAGVEDVTKAEDAWLTSNRNNFSEWSTACLLAPIAQPSFVWPSYANNKLPVIFTLNSEIKFKIGDKDAVVGKDALQSYRLKVINPNGTVIEDSGEIMAANASTDYGINYSFETLFTSDLTVVGTITLSLEYTTVNGYSENIFRTYDLMAAESADILAGTVSNRPDLGATQLIFDFSKEDSLETSSFSIRRSDYLTNFVEWETIATFNSIKQINELPLRGYTPHPSLFVHQDNETGLEEDTIKYTYFDYSVEHGHIYQYGIYEEESETFRKFDGEVLADFEDMFLIGANEVLNIKFNPTVSNLRYNIAESITPTLGGVYPYVRRNGHQRYRSFSIGGMISYSMDSSYTLDEAYDSTEKPFKEVFAERLFREKVMEFLYANNVKLFKSATEGNILVMLTAVSLTPEKALGRRIYSFTATATEVDANTFDNYKKHKIFTDAAQYKYVLNAQTYRISEGSGIATVQEDVGYENDTNSAIVQEVEIN